jgi:hypothetical protein
VAARLDNAGIERLNGVRLHEQATLPSAEHVRTAGRLLPNLPSALLTLVQNILFHEDVEVLSGIPELVQGCQCWFWYMRMLHEEEWHVMTLETRKATFSCPSSFRF